MILDSSAVLAVLFREQGRERLEEALAAATVLAIGSPTVFETTMVAFGSLGHQGRSLVAQYLDRWNVVVTPFDARHAQLAAEAFARYGKGRHPARLNSATA